IILNRKRELMYYNMEVCRFLGYQPEQFERLNTRDWLRVKDSHALMIGKQGETLRSNVYRAKIKTTVDDGECELIILRDFPQKRKVNLLHQFSGTFMKDVNLGILLISADFVLLDISDMACRILGMEKEKVVNKPIE